MMWYHWVWVAMLAAVFGYCVMEGYRGGYFWFSLASWLVVCLLGYGIGSFIYLVKDTIFLFLGKGVG